MLPHARSRVGTFVLIAVASGAAPAWAQRTFTVSTTADTVDATPGDGLCADAAGSCSLRAAVMEASTAVTSGGDRVDLPPGLYRLDLGPLKVMSSMRIEGRAGGRAIIESGGPYGAFELGSVLYAQKLFQGTDTVTGMLLPKAIPTSTDSFANCLAAEGCLGKPGLVDTGGSLPLHPISFDFTLTAAERTAVAGAGGVGILTVAASRDIGHKPTNAVPDVVGATLDSVTVGDLFQNTIDSCPDGENFGPIDFDCGPNFHNDVIGSGSLFVSGPSFQAAAADGSLRVLLSAVSGAATAGVGRLKIFSVELLYLKQADVILSGLTVQGASNSALLNNGASVSASDVVIKSGSAPLGAALWNQFGSVVLRDCTVADNTAFRAGGLYNARMATLTLERCTVSGNTATVRSGGGISNWGTLTLTNTTVSGNLAALGGGGLENEGVLTSSFSTISDNSANLDLSKNFDPAAVGGGMANLLGGRVKMSDTILAGNRDGRDSGLPTPPDLVSPDCFGRSAGTAPKNFVSERDNVVGIVNGNCAIEDRDPAVSGLPFDQAGTAGAPLDAGLGPLTDNGGLTRTHALETGSPAIDADHSTGVLDCPATDERGFRRPGDDVADIRCDAGAFEAGGRTEVPVDPVTGASPVTVTFSTINTPGVTRVSVLSSGPPPPSGFALGTPPVYFELTTTTGFSGPVTVCMDYTGITFPDPTMIKLLHYEDTDGDMVADTWVDRTTSVDTVKKIVCATVTSFSLFAPFQAVNRPPVANAGPDQLLECAGGHGAPARLDGTASSDPDGDPLQFDWTDASGASVGQAGIVTVDVPLGAHPFALTVDDGRGLQATDGVMITVSDTSRPVLSGVAAHPDVLWPPNHRMVPVTVDAHAADVCDAAVACRIVTVSSTEPPAPSGAGPDWEITGALTLSLRAEREGRGPGRTYAVTVECRDGAGNSARGMATVMVPHDRR